MALLHGVIYWHPLANLIVVLLLCRHQNVDSFSPIHFHKSPRISAVPAASSADDGEQSSSSSSVREYSQKTVVVAGATGYIGRAVVQESVRRGHHTIALVRDKSKVVGTPEGRYRYGECFAGATVIECDVVNDPQSLNAIMKSSTPPVHTVVSCLASPTGMKKDVYAVDYQATLDCLKAGQEVGARHFILLSAFCCRNPLLQLQQAKLKLEAELQKQSKMSYSIVRPTAFFKSVSGQLEGIKGGSPYVLFGNGAITRCNPIAESELAEFMLDSMIQEEKKNKILNVGGPDQPLTNQMLGEMMFKAIGQEPKFVYAPTWIFDSVINTLQFLATIFKSEALENAAETARIGKYYAVEDMLTTDPSEKYGKITMQDHYNKIAAAGQDPFTPVRATAAIGRTLKLIPSMSIAIPAMYLIANPRAVEQAVDLSGSDFSMMLASALNSGFPF